MEQEEFYNRVKIGDQIPPLEKEAKTSGQGGLPQIFGGIQLEAESDKAQEKAEELGVDSLHTTRVFGGVTMLHFISDMITDWLPNPKGWVQGGKLSAKFTGLVRINEIITCKGQIKDKIVKDNRRYLICDVWVENVAGDKVVVGEVDIAF